MAYTPLTWANGALGGTPISAARLTHHDDALVDIDGRVTDLESLGGGGGGGSGSVIGGPGVIYVAASDAPTAEKEKADYTCDGSADNVQIQAAINAMKTARGKAVQLSQGTFNLAAQLTLSGSNDVDDPQQFGFFGAGPSNTTLVAGSGLTSALALTQVARVNVSDFGIQVDGSTHGISSVATNNATAGYRSFWLSSIKNIEVVGDFDTHSGYAFHFESPFRSVFENLECNGTGNGMRMFSSNNNFNPGDCTITRCFMDIVGNNHRAYSIESTATDGNMNQIEFSMCEAIASGTGCTGIYLGGTGPVNHTKWHGINLEQFDTCFHINNGEGNIVDGNYWELRAGADNTSLIRFDTAAKGNQVTAVGMFYTNDTVRLITSTASNTTEPNEVRHVKIEADDNCVVTNSISTAGAVLRKWIVKSGSGNTTGVNVAAA